MIKQLRRILAAVAVSLALGNACYASTIAITEFIIDPLQADEIAPEWVELFNYGLSSVDIGGWTLKDNSSATYTFPAGFTIASGDYAIVTGGGASPAPPAVEQRRKNFVDRWLGGVDDPRVASTFFTFATNNTSNDGYTLRNANGDLIWNLGYTLNSPPGGLDETGISPYRATFLAINDFSVNDYGLNTAPKINRNGIDLTGTLGYEDNNRTADPYMYLSSNSTQANQQYGSPLRGHYTVIPEPSTLVLMFGLAGGIYAFGRRR